MQTSRLRIVRSHEHLGPSQCEGVFWRLATNPATGRLLWSNDEWVFLIDGLRSSIFWDTGWEMVERGLAELQYLTPDGHGLGDASGTDE